MSKTQSTVQKATDNIFTTGAKILAAFMTISLTVMIISGWEFFSKTILGTLATLFLIGIAVRQTPAGNNVEEPAKAAQASSYVATAFEHHQLNTHHTILFQYVYIVILFAIGIVLGGITTSANALVLFALVSAAYFACIKIVRSSSRSTQGTKILLINFIGNSLTSYVALSFIISTLHWPPAHVFVAPAAMILGLGIASFEQQHHKFDLLIKSELATMPRELPAGLIQTAFKHALIVMLSLLLIILDCTVLDPSSYKHGPIVLIATLLPLAYCWRYSCHVRDEYLGKQAARRQE